MARPAPIAAPAPDARHLLHVFPSFGIGGVPLRMARIFNHLGPRYRHTIIALDENAAAGAAIAPNASVELVPFAVDKAKPLVNLMRFHGELRSRRPDLLVTYNWGAIEWAMVNRFVPVCRHLHHEAGFGVEEAEGQIRRRVLYRRLALGRALCVVVPSLTLQRIAAEIWRLPARQLQLIPNGIDIARFSSRRAPGAASAFARHPGETVIGTVAPLRPEKNLARLVRVFAQAAGRMPLRLVIAGDGKERAGLEKLARELGLGDGALFLGNVAKPETILADFDIFAISSDTEQMPNTILEAMAAGLPVLGTDVGDIKEMVAPENRPFILPKEAEAALADAACTLAAADRGALGAANRERAARHYSQDQMFTAWDAVFSL
jgi:glycosyltransferase involved in cell wall biosynthesis